MTGPATTHHTPGGSGWVRRTVHCIAIVLGWVLFAWGWIVVTADRPDPGDLRTLLIGSLVVLPVLTVAWVLHNVGIHRRKGPRRSVPRADMYYERDFNQREVQADWAALASAQFIDIEVDGAVKRFVARNEAP